VACTIQLVFFFFFAICFISPGDYYCPTPVANIQLNGHAIYCTSAASGLQAYANAVKFDAHNNNVPPTSNNSAVQQVGVMGKNCFAGTDGAYTPMHDEVCPEIYPAARYKFTLPVLAIVIIVILNDVCIITIARDKVIPNKLPQNWRLKELGVMATICGLIPCLSSMLLLLAGLNSGDGSNGQFAKMLGDEITVRNQTMYFLSYPKLVMLLYLKISISDFLTVFSARTRSWFFSRRPGYALGAAAVFATSVSTIIASTSQIPDEDFNMEPIASSAVGYIWLFNFGFFVFQDIAKIAAYWAFDQLDEPTEFEVAKAARKKASNAIATQNRDLRASGTIDNNAGRRATSARSGKLNADTQARLQKLENGLESVKNDVKGLTTKLEEKKLL
jgi:hypothetical protein